jgi:hypothetical protein
MTVQASEMAASSSSSCLAVHEVTSSVGLKALPAELLLDVLGHASLEVLVVCAHTCRYLRELVLSLLAPGAYWYAWFQAESVDCCWSWSVHTDCKRRFFFDAEGTEDDRAVFVSRRVAAFVQTLCLSLPWLPWFSSLSVKRCPVQVAWYPRRCVKDHCRETLFFVLWKKQQDAGCIRCLSLRETTLSYFRFQVRCRGCSCQVLAEEWGQSCVGTAVSFGVHFCVCGVLSRSGFPVSEHGACCKWRVSLCATVKEPVCLVD